MLGDLGVLDVLQAKLTYAGQGPGIVAKCDRNPP
jgi:hypothetical protein